MPNPTLIDPRTTTTPATPVAAPLIADEAGLQWVHLVPAGSTFGRDGRGPYTLDEAAVTAAFAAHGADLPVDYEHQSLQSAQRSGPVPAAGWITAVQVRADGLWGCVRWTAQAAQLLSDRAYRYLSAVFDHLPDGRVVALRGAGLVHSPNLPLTAAASQQTGGGVPLLTMVATLPVSDLSLSTTTVAAMAAQGQTMTIEELKAQVAALTAQLAEAKAAMAAAQGAADAATQQAAQAAAQAAAPNPAQWVPMGQYQAAVTQLSALQNTQATSAVQTAVTAAMSAGKVAPAQKEWATAYAAQDPAGFAAFVSASPVIVSAQAQLLPAHGVLTAAQGALSDSDREVAKLLGVSAQDFAKALV